MLFDSSRLILNDPANPNNWQRLPYKARLKQTYDTSPQGEFNWWVRKDLVSDLPASRPGYWVMKLAEREAVVTYFNRQAIYNDAGCVRTRASAHMLVMETFGGTHFHNKVPNNQQRNTWLPAHHALKSYFSPYPSIVSASRVQAYLWSEVIRPKDMSNEKNPGCLGYIGDYTTQLYGDCDKPL